MSTDKGKGKKRGARGAGVARKKPTPKARTATTTECTPEKRLRPARRYARIAAFCAAVANVHAKALPPGVRDSIVQDDLDAAGKHATQAEVALSEITLPTDAERESA